MNSTKAVEIPYTVIQSMTKTFSKENRLGSGGYADVFKALPSIPLAEHFSLISKGEPAFDQELANYLMGLPACVAVKRDKRETGHSSTGIAVAELEQADRTEEDLCERYQHRSLCCLLGEGY